MPGKFLIIDNSKDGVAFDFLLNKTMEQTPGIEQFVNSCASILKYLKTNKKNLTQNFCN